LETAGLDVQLLSVRDQSSEDFVYSKFNSPKIIQAVKDIEQADAVIVATPIYKASYTGVLKSFLDLLPQKGLQGKIVLPFTLHPEIERRLHEAAKTFAQEVIWRSERVYAAPLQEEDVQAG
jgi:FMN reductase